MIDAYGISDVGLVRSVNQDRFAITSKKKAKTQAELFALVCDGIGGAKAGEVASEQTIQYLKKAFEASGEFHTSHELEGWMYQQIRSVNDRVFAMALTDDKYTGMGTTLVACMIHDQMCRIAHVGDSRAYYLHQDEFTCLTQDHTYMNELLRQGDVSMEEAHHHPKRNYLTNAIGVFNQIRIDMIALDEGFDCILLCSDGLHSMVSESKLQVILRQPWSAKEKCELLVQAANQFGGIDNITVVILQKEEIGQ